MLAGAFFDQLQAAHLKLGNQFCMGIDPDVAKLQGFLQKEFLKKGRREFLFEFSKTLINAAKGHVGSVKFQSAYYEACGAEGILALKDAVAYARSEGLLSILDCKRGDIGSTLSAYGEAMFGYFAADAITFSPYMGVRVLDALLPWFKKGKGVYVVWISSNPEAFELQKNCGDLILDEVKSWRHKNQLLNQVGVVLGATKVAGMSAAQFKASSELPLLLPGLGAQGAEVGARFNEIEQCSPASAWPVSRGFSGIDSKDALSAFLLMKSWGDYLEYVLEQVAKFTENS
jgi:orotidine-5'-phosphate decarboxylase